MVANLLAGPVQLAKRNGGKKRVKAIYKFNKHCHSANLGVQKVGVFLHISSGTVGVCAREAMLGTAQWAHSQPWQIFVDLVTLKAVWDVYISRSCGNNPVPNGHLFGGLPSRHLPPKPVSESFPRSHRTCQPQHLPFDRCWLAWQFLPTSEVDVKKSQLRSAAYYIIV